MHLVNHAQRMLVRNLTEQAWQRAQLRKAGTEKARKRLRAALADNARRSEQIRETVDRLPGEYAQRQRARHEATRDRLKAQLKAGEQRLAGTTRGGKRLKARRARLETELVRVELARAGVAAPPLHEGRYLRRAWERNQAELARLGAALADLDRQLTDAHALGDSDRVRTLRAYGRRLRALHGEVEARAAELRGIPGASQLGPGG